MVTKSNRTTDDLSGLLLDWYDENKRSLPWREDPAPYHVWLSEIMLQQTRAETVIPYYERFLKALPDIAWDGGTGRISFNAVGDVKRSGAFIKRCDTSAGKWTYVTKANAILPG